MEKAKKEQGVKKKSADLLMQAFDFTAEELEVNAAGFLADTQRKKLWREFHNHYSTTERFFYTALYTFFYFIFTLEIFVRPRTPISKFERNYEFTIFILNYRVRKRCYYL